MLRSKKQRDLCQSQAQRCMLLRRAYEMSDKQFVYADRAVFSTSKVCKDALYIKHKYAQDEYNWLN